MVFVRNIYSQNQFDVIRADVVLERLEKQAHKGCGLHYEIYQSRLLQDAMDYLDQLPLKHRATFIDSAACRGLELTLEEEQRAKQAGDKLMASLANDDIESFLSRTE